MPGAMVDRSPLIETLQRHRGVVLVLAAAGTGKTTLLRQWDAADERPFVWMPPDPGGSDADALVARFAAAAEPVVFVLDDIHAGADAGTLIRRLADLEVADGVAVAISGRGIERRARARLHLRPELFEVGEDDLALDEAAAAGILDGEADAEAVRLLVNRTRGWAAGLQLARRALAAGRAAPEGFTGADPIVRDYVAGELLEDLDAGLVEFVLRTAPFDELTGPLCDTALATTGSAQRLDDLARRHLFLSAVDRDERAFRWHPLVREALAAELDRRDPGAARTLRSRGADWLAAHGAARQAVTLRLADGDRERALELLADVVLPLFYDGRLDEVVGIIHGIGADIAVGNGYLATMFAYAGMMTGDDVCARRWTRAAAEYYRTQSFTETDEQVAFLTLRAHLCADGVQRMRVDAEAARVRVKESSPWRAPTLMLSGIAAGLCGDSATAVRALDEAIHVSEETAAGPALVLSLAERVEFGERGSEELLERAVRAATEGRHSRYPQSALATALEAAALSRTRERPGAEAALARAHQFRPAVGGQLPWLAVQVRLHIVRAMASLGDVPGARVVLAEAEEILRPLRDAGTLRRTTGELAAALRPLSGDASAGSVLLTTAELRLLPLLSSHLSFGEIGERLHVSRNTIKTQASSVYRKLGVSSRSDAVAHATRLGLVEA